MQKGEARKIVLGGIRLGTKRLKRWPCRCSACGRRVTKAQQPEEYVRPPRCPSGCRRRDERGRASGFAELRIDYWRILKEWKRKPCYCYGYSFPHVRGRGYCEHNPRLTAEMLQEREECGRWA